MRPPTQPPAFHVTQERFADALARTPHRLPPLTLTIHATEEPGLAERLREAHVLIGSAVPAAAVAANDGPLELIQLSSAGYDHLLPLDWLPEHVALANASGVHAPKLAEWATMAFLMLHTGVPRLVDAQRQHRWAQQLTPSIAGRRALVFGTGALGQAVAKAAGALGIEVAGVRRTATATPGFATVVARADAEALLPEADFVVLATPLTPETEGLIGAAALARMKPGAGLINVGRGGLVDQAALAEALRSGRLGGAILDVTTPEPLPADSDLWDTPGLMLTPHVSCDDPETYVPRVLDLLLENLHRRLGGRPVLNRVTPAR